MHQLRFHGRPGSVHNATNSATISTAAASCRLRSHASASGRRRFPCRAPLLARQRATDRASVIFRNGKVYTLDARKPWAQAVAVAGDKIVAVGSDADVLALAGPETKVIDLAGRMLMPGFVESHIHPFLGAFMTAGVDLQVPTAKDALAAIAAFAKAHPTGTIRGFGWRVDMFPPEGPTREMLDAVIADRPAFFLAIDAHSLWANSKALEIAKIDAHTPDPVPGFSYYVRDRSGRPTGYVMETSAHPRGHQRRRADLARLDGEAARRLAAQGVRRGHHIRLRRGGSADRRRSGRDPRNLYGTREAGPAAVPRGRVVSPQGAADRGRDRVHAGADAAHRHRPRPGAHPEDARRRNAGGLHRMAHRAVRGQAGFDRQFAFQRGAVEERDPRGGQGRDRRAYPRLRRAHGSRRARRDRGRDRSQCRRATGVTRSRTTS